MTANTNCRVCRKAPVCTKAVDRIGWRVEVLDDPVLEHPRFAIANILALPDVQIFVWIAAQIVFHLVAQNVRKPRVVGIVDLNHDAVARRVAPTQQRFNWVILISRVPTNQQLRAGLADCRAQ